MEDQVCFGSFIERRTERHEEVVRQVANEADRVRQDDCRAVRQMDLAQRGVQRGEQLIGGKGLAPVIRLNSVDLPALV